MTPESQNDVHEPFTGAARLLEKLDNIAHILVGLLFLLAALGVLLYTGGLAVRQLQLVGTSLQPQAAGMVINSGDGEGLNQFFHISLEMLSSILFLVILLELLKTIITYLTIRSIQATLKEFIMVGIISLIRKILLVGAQASLASEGAKAYVQESIGSILSVGAILLLVGGLILLQRYYDPSKPSAE